jgi:hypothetical protein
MQQLALFGDPVPEELLYERCSWCGTPTRECQGACCCAYCCHFDGYWTGDDEREPRRWVPSGWVASEAEGAKGRAPGR